MFILLAVDPLANYYDVARCICASEGLVMQTEEADNIGVPFVVEPVE